jgi:hypothetical protein
MSVIGADGNAMPELYRAPWPAAIPGPAPRKGRARLVAIVCGLAVIVAGIAIVTRHHGPSYPDHWDARVQPMVDFVEAHRGLTFKHPVEVDFLSSAAYSKQTRTEESDLSKDDKASFDREEKFFRALGLLHGHVDLFSAGNTLQDNGTLAFYSPETKKVTVRGTDITVDLRVTLVHELTHAAQDQYFDIRKMQKSSDTSGEEFGARALIEGDAVRIENEYIDKLSAADKDAYDKAQPGSASDAGLGDVPTALLALFAAPYQFGLPFVYMLDDRGGQSTIDGAFRHPPTSEEQLLDPAAYLEHDDPDPLKVHPGAKKELDKGDFGALSLYLVLAEHIDARVALKAADGWKGDGYFLYDKDKATMCVDARFTADTTADLDELDGALKEWRDAMPAKAVTVAESGDEVHLVACDPGPDKSADVTGDGAKALVLPEVRSYEFGKALRSKFTVDQAKCFSQHVIDALSIEQLNGESTLSDDALGAVEQQAATACAPH